MTLLGALDAAITDLGDDPIEKAMALVARARTEPPAPAERAAVAAAIARYAAALQTWLDEARAADLTRVGAGRRALRGYGHLRPQRRAQRVSRRI